MYCSVDGWSERKVTRVRKDEEALVERQTEGGEFVMRHAARGLYQKNPQTLGAVHRGCGVGCVRACVRVLCFAGVVLLACPSDD